MRFLHFGLIVVAAASMGASVVHGSKPNSGATPPHLDPEMTGYEYQRVVKSHDTPPDDPDQKTLQPVFDLGERNLAWLTYMNSKRPTSSIISLSSKATEGAHPINDPLTYNVPITMAKYQDLLKQMPPEMAKVLVQGGDFTDNPPIAMADYIRWGLNIDNVYQTATRWILLKPYMSWYLTARNYDIRGYYFLGIEKDLSAELAGFSALPTAKQTQLTDWLLGLCANTTSDRAACATELSAITTSKQTVQPFYDKYLSGGESMYTYYFTEQWPRKDLTWTSKDVNLLSVPFADPGDAGVLAYLRDNIEDEWQWKGWHLRLAFAPMKDGMPHVTFQQGQTPHVSLPDTIIMDQNQPTTEYDAQWVIRHEFGHIMGFPDCYVEYYDTDQNAMVNYQIDVDNLMCSRRGKFQQSNYDELKRVYFVQ